MPTAPPTHARKVAGKLHGQSQAQVNRQRSRGLHTGSKAWRAIRREVLARDMYLCRDCRKYGNEVDHIDGDSHNNDPDNLQTLCKPCHAKKTAVETGRVRVLPTLNHKPLMPVTVIAGPPGSGKTTWARERAGPKDLILDLDDIKAKLSETAAHDSPDEVVWPALAERNDVLYSLSRRADVPHVWFVCMAPRMAERRHWRENLSAEVVVLEVSPDECIRRITNDPSRKDKALWERLVREWWSKYTRDDQGEDDAGH